MRISITILQYDHGIIRQVLDVVGELLRSHRASRYGPELKEALTFLEQFLDRFHHAKEERFLFPAAMEECPKVAETLALLKKEHVQARRTVRSALRALEEGNVEKAERDAMRLVERITLHISEEENQVFPVIENFLAMETDAKLYEQYQAFMQKKFGAGYYQVAEAFANDIQDRVLGPGFFKGIV